MRAAASRTRSLPSDGGWPQWVARAAKDKPLSRLRVGWHGDRMRKSPEAEAQHFREYPDIEIAVARNQFWSS